MNIEELKKIKVGDKILFCKNIKYMDDIKIGTIISIEKCSFLNTKKCCCSLEFYHNRKCIGQVKINYKNNSYIRCGVDKEKSLINKIEEFISKDEMEI